MTSIKIIDIPYSPGNPPRDFNKRESIGTFFCMHKSDNSFKCYEFLRATATSRGGDIYIIPYPVADPAGFHMSYHRRA